MKQNVITARTVSVVWECRGVNMNNISFFKMNETIHTDNGFGFNPTTLELSKGKECLNKAAFNSCSNEINWIPFNQRKRQIGKVNYMLNLSHTCNLSCDYCFAGGGTYNGSEEFMTFEVAKASVNHLIKKTLGKKIHISFFGGEPLLNESVLVEAVNYAVELAKKHEKKITFSVSTNGTVVTERFLKLVRNNNIHVTVSMDGTKDIHDNCRKYKNGLGSFEDVNKNLVKLIQEVGTEKTACRITRPSFTPPDFSVIENIYKTGVKSIYYSEVLPVTSGDAFVNESVAQDKRLSLISEYRKFFFQYVDFVDKNHFLAINPYYRLINAVFTRRNVAYHCGAGNTLLSITPVGDVFACYRFIESRKLFMGNIVNGKLDYRVGRKILSWHEYRTKKCENCWAISICYANHCLHQNLLRGRGYEAINSEVQCIFMKEFLQVLFECIAYIVEEKKLNLFT